MRGFVTTSLIYFSSLFEIPLQPVLLLFSRLSIAIIILNSYTHLILYTLTLDCNLNFKSHLKTIGTKISRVIGLLHKLKYIFPAYLLRMIYNSLILPHINYCLLAWGSNCHSVELLQKKLFELSTLNHRLLIQSLY